MQRRQDVYKEDKMYTKKTKVYTEDRGIQTGQRYTKKT